MSYKYTITEPNEDPNLTVIEKTGAAIIFTPLEIQNNLAYAKKKKSEIAQVLRVSEAKKVNIKRTHPHIAEMSLEDLTAAYLYRESIGASNEALDKLAELDAAIAEDEKALLEITEQTGLVIPSLEKSQPTEEVPSAN